MEEKDNIFLTPPLSDDSKNNVKSFGRPYFYKYGNSVPKFQLDSEDRLASKNQNQDTVYVDFINELYRLSLTSTVCSKIFKQLTDLELIRASHVSSTWRSVIRYNELVAGRRTSRYVRKMKSNYFLNKENSLRGKVDNFKTDEVYIIPPLLTLRTPLTNKNTNTMITPINSVSRENENSSLFLTPSPLESDTTYRKCPECQSPSRTTQNRTGHCDRCDHDFCLNCFYTHDNHSPSCTAIGGHGLTTSPNKLMKRNRRYSVGTKDNKARLKRL